MDDNQLAKAAAEGNQEAFATIVKRYRNYIYAIAYKISLNEQDALDVTQNVFLRLVDKIADFRATGSFRSWLGTITARETIDFLRAPGRRERPTEDEEIERTSLHGCEVGSDNPRKTSEKSERLARVHRAVAQLSEQQRAILLLRLHEDLGPKEIGERLGIPAGQVRSQTNRGVRKVRELLGLNRSSHTK